MTAITRPLPEIVRLSDGEELRLMPQPGIPQAVYLSRGAALRVLVAWEPFNGTEAGNLLHISLSHPNRLPNWRTLKLVKDAFFGNDVAAIVVLPKAEEYVNVHPHTHHLWEHPE